MASGYLTPTGTDREDLPQVVRLVRPAVDHLAAAAKLLDNPPPLPGEVSGSLPRWLEIADWWAAVRLHFAAAPPASFNDAAVVTGQAWWNKTDTAWVAWLRAHYGAQLSRSHVTPATVDKIGAHLNHAAVVQGDKVLLLVMDGMGVAQWQYLRKVLNLTVATDRRVLAMLPTITSVSRQAIFAGQLPTRFPDSINRTDAEDRRWREFWIKAGLSDREVHYARTPGRHAGDWPDLPDASVVGVAINAVDDLVHGSDVNDDHQLLASLGTWAHAGLVPAALAWARRHGHRVWLTADHGNVVSQGLGQPIPNEGAAVPSRGIRVRQYANPVLRNVSKLPGIAWDPPGYPPTSRPLLFAPGSMCYRNSATLVTHGGLSLDEVVIPFVEVIP
ncbi:PglZ domain-containing protein [Micromonospora sp. NPDC007208]|uniref:PglZ domain-containing protein n=1 Tax=Micromonospora sp. NPDC007208 TaxID=3364236 RepID=UPI0036AB2384